MYLRGHASSAFQSKRGPGMATSWWALVLVLAASGCTTLGLDDVVGVAAGTQRQDPEAGRDAAIGPRDPSPIRSEYYASAVPDAYRDVPVYAPAVAGGHTAATTAAEPSIDEAADVELAQFAVPQAPAEGQAAPAPLAGQLKFEYVFGTEGEVEYLSNVDLDDNLQDDSIVMAPTVFGSITYRPTNWLETRVEITFEKLIDVREENVVLLPDGTLQRADEKKASLLIDQAFARFKPSSVPVELTVGRRNFEDQRLWLYDTALDGVILTVKPGDFNIEASWTRENLVDLDLLTSSPTSRINNYIVYAEFRGIADNRLAGYWILLDDRKKKDGAPQIFGVRAIGRPTDPFNYWTELAFTRGSDENSRDLKGYGYEAGGTYRFLDFPLQPSITLGYAFGSGDNNPNDNTNDEFRQTGLGSNEARFGGVTQFVSYGEMLAPELSNINIWTAGIGFRPAAGAFVDLVYHHYRFDELADEVRGSNLTAQTNQVAGRESKDIGDELDIILGFRDLFGVRGLGLEMRAGIFFPGDAFLRDNGAGGIEDADTGVSALVVSFF